MRAAVLTYLGYLGQGTLTEGEGSVQLNSSLRYLFVTDVINLINFKMSRFKQVTKRRSTVLSPSLKLGFHALGNTIQCL